MAFFSKELLGNHAYEIRRLFHTLCSEGISDSDGRNNLFILVSFDPPAKETNFGSSLNTWVKTFALLPHSFIYSTFFPRSDLRAGSEGEREGGSRFEIVSELRVRHSRD